MTQPELEFMFKTKCNQNGGQWKPLKDTSWMHIICIVTSTHICVFGIPPKSFIIHSFLVNPEIVDYYW
jgi:hypothetical protein